MTSIFPQADTQVVLSPPGQNPTNTVVPELTVPEPASPTEPLPHPDADLPEPTLQEFFAGVQWIAMRNYFGGAQLLISRSTSGTDTATLSIATAGDANQEYGVIDMAFDDQLQSAVLLMFDGDTNAPDYNAETARLFIGLVPYRDNAWGDLEIVGRDQDTLDETPEDYIKDGNFRYNTISAAGGLVFVGRLQDGVHTMRTLRLFALGYVHLPDLDRVVDFGETVGVSSYRFKPVFRFRAATSGIDASFIDGYEFFSTTAGDATISRIIDNVATDTETREIGATAVYNRKHHIIAPAGMADAFLPTRTANHLTAASNDDWIIGKVNSNGSINLTPEDGFLAINFVVPLRTVGSFYYITDPIHMLVAGEAPPVVPPEPNVPVAEGLTRYEFFLSADNPHYGGAGYVFTDNMQFNAYTIDADGDKTDLVFSIDYTLSAGMNLITLLDVASHAGERLVVESTRVISQREAHQPFNVVLRRIGVNFIDAAYFNPTLGGYVPDRRLVVEADSPQFPPDFYTAYRATITLGQTGADTWSFQYNNVLYVLDAFELDDESHTLRLEFIF